MNILNPCARVLPRLSAALLAAGVASACGQTGGQTANLPASAIAAALALAREAAAVGAPPGARIEVLAGPLDGRLRLAPCTRIDPTMSPGARPWGRTRVGLRCAQGPTPWNVSLPVTVKVFAPALVGTMALPIGTPLETDQLRLAEVDWAAETSPVQTRAEAMVGRVLARPLAAGQALRSSDLRPRQWFAAGDTVRIIAGGDGFSVSAEGQALSNGIEGQTARVRTESGHLVSGLPVGDRKVEVPL